MSHGANSQSISGPVSRYLALLRPTIVPDQTERGYQSARDLDSIYTDSNLGGFGNAGLPGLQHPDFGLYFNPDWTPQFNTAPQTEDFGLVSTLSMNQAVSPSNPSHTVAQQYQWSHGNQITPSNLFQNNSGVTGYPNPGGFAGPVPQVQSSNDVGNSQFDTPPFGTQVVRERYVF